ncbi:hypothetical protein QBC31_40860 [Streptomyces sp. B21-079]|uniref:hypothetical protein n=1 Tax=Streptomyces sp. B21-079 TaxID=3039409 RepID=UPI002FF023B2
MTVALGGTVLLVAQPSLQRSLAASPAQIQWTSTGFPASATACVGLLGFVAVMVTATATATATAMVVGDAPREYAGAVVGLKRTARNIGPTSRRSHRSAGAAASLRTILLLMAAVVARGLLPSGLLPRARKHGAT